MYCCVRNSAWRVIQIVVNAYADAIATTPSNIGKTWVAAWSAGQIRDEVMKSIDEKSAQFRKVEPETSEEADGQREQEQDAPFTDWGETPQPL